MKNLTRHACASLCLMCTALLLSTAFIACGDSDDSDNPGKPDIPVNPEDFQNVPITGGTITKGNIALTFPSGTYGTDTKVAITELKKGEIGGEYEASPFYQITMPCTASKPLTIKIKCEEQNDDIACVAYADAFCMSSQSENKAELIYNTTYSNGEYSATIPAINGDIEGENVVFTIGLGHMISYPAAAATRSAFDEVLQEGKVGTVTYKVRFPWWTLCTFSDETLVQVEMKSKTIAGYVESALTEIFNLGFKIDGEKTLYIDFAGGDDWGGHQVCGIPGEGGWSMWVALGIKKLLDSNTTEADIKCTVIHEILHWVHAISYDPRSNFKKSKKQYGGEELVMYEMGAVWAEQFMNNGNMNAKFLSDYLDTFLRGALDANIAKSNYGEHGYGMSALLYYLTKKNKIKQEKVVDMYDIWKEDGMANKSFEPFRQWIKQNNSKFLENGDFYNFVFQLYSGKLVNDNQYINPAKLSLATIKSVAIKNDDKIIQKGDCGAYGIITRRFRADYYRNAYGKNSFKDKEIVFKQTEPDVMTFVIACADADETNFKVYEKKIAPGDSLVISGDAADALFESGPPYSFVVVSVNSTDSKKSANITCEIRNTTPQLITFLEFDGSVKTKMTTTYHDGHTRVFEGASAWISHLRPGGNTKISGTLSGTTLHVEAVSTVVNYDTTHHHISFDVKNFVAPYRNVELANLYAKIISAGGSTTIGYHYDKEWELKILEAPLYQSYSIPNDTSCVFFRGYQKDGFKVDSYYYKENLKYYGKIDGKTAIKEEHVFLQDAPENFIWLRFFFKE